MTGDEGPTIGELLQPRREKTQPSLHMGLSFIGLEHIEAHSMKRLGSVPAEAMRSQANRFCSGDVLYSRLRPYLNKVWRADRDGLCSSEFIVLPGTEFVDPDFLRYRLNARDFVQFANSLNAGDRPRVDFEQISSFGLPLFSLDRQKRIVAKIEELFSELDKGIENLKLARSQLTVYRQALLKHAFEGKLTADWRAANADQLETDEQIVERIRSQHALRYERELAEWKIAAEKWDQGKSIGKRPSKPTKPGVVSVLSAPDLELLLPLPQGWIYLKVSSLCEVVRGGSPRPAGDPAYYDGDIPFLKVGDLTQNAGVYLDTFKYTIKEAGLTKTRFVKPPTLMISNSGATLGVPKICRIETTFNDGIAAFLGVREEEQLYQYYFWEGQTAHLRAIDQGAAQPNLNTDLLRDVALPCCCAAEMQAVVAEIERQLSAIDATRSDIEMNLEKSEALRQSILKKAFAGELIPQDPNDEPAAALLARIRAERASIKASSAAAPKTKARKPKTAKA